MQLQLTEQPASMIGMWVPANFVSLPCGNGSHASMPHTHIIIAIGTIGTCMSSVCTIELHHSDVRDHVLA